jgi:hypothetical protein
MVNPNRIPNHKDLSLSITYNKITARAKRGIIAFSATLMLELRRKAG